MLNEYFVQGKIIEVDSYDFNTSTWKNIVPISENIWGENEHDAFNRFIKSHIKRINIDYEEFKYNFCSMCTFKYTGRTKNSYCEGKPFFYNNEQLNKIRKGIIASETFDLRTGILENTDDDEKINYYAERALSYFKMLGNKVTREENHVKIFIPKVNKLFAGLDEIICENAVDIILQWQGYLAERQINKESVLSYLGSAFHQYRYRTNDFKIIFKGQGISLFTTKDLEEDDVWYVLSEHEEKAKHILKRLDVKLPKSFEDNLFTGSSADCIYWAEGEETEEEFWEHEF